MALMNDRRGVFLVLCLAGESELILGLSVGNLVNAVEGKEGITSMRRGGIGTKRRKLRTGTTRS